MTTTLDGKHLSTELEKRLQSVIREGITQANRPPGLAVIRVGDDPASGVYVANKEKACSRVGIKKYGLHLTSAITTTDLVSTINSLNENPYVDGILLQLPLPKGIDEKLALSAIDPNKDADGLHSLNLGKLLRRESGPRSCTPAGIMALLARYDIPVEGKRAVVVGRSILVGQPMALMLQAADATVTVAHSKTKNLTEITREADLLVVAAGKPLMIGADNVSSRTTVIDVGIHRISREEALSRGVNAKLCGDVDFKEVYPIVRAITPVPGGVGPMTVSMLLVNTVSMWQQHCGLSLTLSDLLP